MNSFQRMKINEKKLPVREVRRLLVYDPVDDVLRWKVSCGKMKADDVAGCIDSHGYWRVKINGIIYSGHRLAFVLHHKRWPEKKLDHIDGDKSSLRKNNLREVSNQENGQNTKRYKNNKTGVNGVSPLPNGRYQSYIIKNGKQVYLGIFDTLEEAARARRAADLKYGFHENHGRDDEIDFA